ncbi:MAG TPA: YidC/Oxa1 family membrane protein insertase [Candidatus Limnocylindrales bacterium]|nr:YidC/Oxa1 family membrane protein insertase [Candidatus Limnocylindrales bacterium]
MTSPQREGPTLDSTLRRMLPAVLIVAIVLVVAACLPGGGGSGGVPTPTPTPPPPLHPASPGADPVSLFAWLFTPIFQVMLIILLAVYQFLEGLRVPGAIAWAIVILTLIVRAVLIPLFRRQLVSQRRMQLLQPELREVQKRFKGDAMKARLAQQELMRERGVNVASGCLPLLLQLPLLFIMYSVIQNGLTNQDPRAMLNVFGVQLFELHCQNIVNGVIDSTKTCVDANVPLLGNVAHPQTFLVVAGFGLSVLAILSAVLQLVQSRMMLPAADPTNDDPNVRIQRQMMLFLPIISVVYGGFLPAGLFIYWIVATVFSIVQQYLIVGWGSMFPLFGWTPAFAVDHTPRFPVSMPPAPEPSKRAAILADAQKKTTADKTIRQRSRGRQGRRGRRR